MTPSVSSELLLWRAPLPPPPPLPAAYRRPGCRLFCVLAVDVKKLIRRALDSVKQEVTAESSGQCFLFLACAVMPVAPPPLFCPRCSPAGRWGPEATRPRHVT